MMGAKLKSFQFCAQLIDLVEIERGVMFLCELLVERT